MTIVTKKTQQGMALFVSLIFLLLLTIVGVAAMRNASLQEKMAGNTKLKNESFQYAEAGLREGEAVVKNDLEIGDCSEAVNSQGPDTANVSVSSGTCDVWRASADGNSHFYIEMLSISAAAKGVPTGTFVALYRITAVAAVGNTTTALESIYAKN